MCTVLISLLSVLTWKHTGADSEELDSDDLDEEEEFNFSDEDDDDLDAKYQREDEEISPKELIGSLKSYMDEMDRELAQTNVGKSFTTQKKGVSVPWILVWHNRFENSYERRNMLKEVILSNVISSVCPLAMCWLLKTTILCAGKMWCRCTTVFFWNQNITRV